MTMLKLILSDFLDGLKAIAIVIALASTVIATVAVGTLTVHVIGNQTAVGIDLFLRLMNMDPIIYQMHSTQLVYQSYLLEALALSNWLVLVAGLGAVLIQSAVQYAENLRYRARYASASTAGSHNTVALKSYRSSDSNRDDYKKAGNS